MHKLEKSEAIHPVVISFVLYHDWRSHRHVLSVTLTLSATRRVCQTGQKHFSFLGMLSSKGIVRTTLGLLVVVRYPEVPDADDAVPLLQ